MRSCLMIFLIIFVFLTLPVYFFLINLSEVMSPDFIKKEINRSGVIDQITENLPADLAKGLKSDGTLNEEAIQNSLSGISDQEIRTTLQDNIDKNLTALQNPAAKELVFDISAITSKIPAEVKQMMREQNQAEIKDRYVYKIPLQIRVYRFVSNHLALIKIVGMSVLAVILLLIALLAQAWQTKLRAISLTLLVPGLFILAPFTVLRLIPFDLPKMEGVPAIVTIIASDLFKTIKVDLSNLYILEGSILVFLAFVLFVISAFLPKPSTAPTPAVTQTGQA